MGKIIKTRYEKAQDLQEGDYILSYGTTVQRVLSTGVHHVLIDLQHHDSVTLPALERVEVK